MRRGDLIAGLSVAGLMLPEAVAYAQIAGLPPQRAIFAGIAGCLGYAIFGRSRFAILSPTSSSATILAATLASMPGTIAARAVFATVLVGLIGMLFLLAAVLRLGAFTGFISRPVLRGFAFGLAITIIIRQLPILVGTPIHEPNIFRLGIALVASVPHWRLASVGIGCLALAALLLIRRYPVVPGAFLVLAAGVAASWFFDLPQHGVAIVGAIDTALPRPRWPLLDRAQFTLLLQFTLPLGMILFAESWGTIRALALRHGDRVDATRELGALGVANLASALVQGMPVGAGFSAGAASEAAGAATRATGVIAAVGLAMLIAFGTPLIAWLPQPVLAAAVIAALAHALDPAPLVRLWRLGRDHYIALAAAIGVLVLGVLNGMLVAIALSLAALIHRLATPRVVRLGRLGDSRDYVDVARHADAIAPSDLAIWRPTEPLFFANAERMLAFVAKNAIGDPAARRLIISLEESFDLDSTALDALIEFDGLMRANHISVQLARVHDRVRDLLLAVEETDLPSRSSYSVDDAVTALRQRPSHAEKIS
jgi:MFS superfamily sulfate permease-like transporter